MTAIASNKPTHLGSIQDNEIIDDNNAKEFITPTNYQYLDDNLYLYHDDISRIILNGKITIVCPVIMDDQKYGYLLKIHNLHGYESTKLISGEDIDSTSLKKLLDCSGLNVKDAKAVLVFFRELISLTSKIKPRQVITKMGWYPNQQVFFSGEFPIYAPSGCANDCHFEPTRHEPQRMRQKGTLAEWKAQIGVHVEANDIPLVMVCLSLASVLLEQAQLSSVVFNLCGQSGKGKTLTLQMAASVWGVGCDPAHATSHNIPYISKVQGTANGLEALLPSYSPLPAILDELGERPAKDLAQLCYTLASGTGKHRMTVGRKLATSNQWLLNLLVSSEFAISDLIASCGQEQAGGQADRAIDIPINDIFTDTGHLNGFNDLTRHLKAVTGQFYGTSGYTFIQYCLNNQEEVQDLLNEIPTMVDDFTPSGCGEGEKRVVMRFVMSIIVGVLAINAGILSCDERRIAEAHEYVISLWWRTKANGITLVADLLNSGNVIIVKQYPKLNGSGNVVYRFGGAFIFEMNLFQKVFSNHSKLLRKLKSGNMLKRDQNDRLYHRYCDDDFRGYSIYEEYLLPLLKPPLEETEQSLEDAFDN